MNQGRGGMGSRKHGTSGVSGYSPRFRVEREIELRKEAAQKKTKRQTMYPTISQLIASKDNRKDN